MFAVMLAFVILLALQSYQRAREGSSIEAVAISELHSVAGAFQPPVSDRLRGELVCYARAVVEDEWPAMRQGRSSDLVESWIAKLGQESAIAEPHGAREETAYAQWFDEKAQRRDGPCERLAEATPFVPLPLWFVLVLGASLTLGYMVVQADPAGGAPDSVGTDRLRQRPRDRGPAHRVFARPSVHERHRQHRAQRDARDTRAH